MILRNSTGSVPSTASISVCFRNGSWMACRSASSETTPLRRALLANATSSRISCVSCLRGAANSVPQAAEGRHHRGQRKLQQHRAQGAAKHDERRRGLQNLAQVAAFNQQSGNNPGDGQKRSADARFVHMIVPSRNSATLGFYCVNRRSASSGSAPAGCPSTSRLANAATRSRSPK